MWLLCDDPSERAGQVSPITDGVILPKQVNHVKQVNIE
jgi:hypothetical protein